jgi:hypothetical protein
MVASGSVGEPGARVSVQCELYDVDGAHIQNFTVDFPEREVGVIELEPMLSSLKMRSGIAQGHLVVRSRAGTKHLCRQQAGDSVSFSGSPRAIKSREMTFLPLLLGARREHIVTLLNQSDEGGQVVIRLMYGTRSPEWTVDVPARGTRAISLENELLATFDDVTWQKGVVQGYLRLSPRAQSEIVCQMIERSPAEGDDKEHFRFMTAW